MDLFWWFWCVRVVFVSIFTNWLYWICILIEQINLQKIHCWIFVYSDIEFTSMNGCHWKIRHWYWLLVLPMSYKMNAIIICTMLWYGVVNLKVSINTCVHKMYMKRFFHAFAVLTFSPERDLWVNSIQSIDWYFCLILAFTFIHWMYVKI